MWGKLEMTCREDGRRRRGLSRFLRCDGGNVALIAALIILPMIVVVGGGLDYYAMMGVRSRLSSAADAAVLAATNRAAMAMTPANAGSRADVTFRAGLSSDIVGDIKTAAATVTEVGGVRTATYTYEVNTHPIFLPMIGVAAPTLAGSATASVQLPTYIDFYLLLDNSPSMGVAATTSGIATMVANTPDQCAFACHDMSTTPNDYYGLAKKLGVAMRIDVVRTATQQLMDTATATQAVPNQFRMAIYSFGAKAETAGLTTVAALTSNLSSAKTSANAIDLMTMPYQGYNSDQQTNFNSVLTSINTAIPTPGSGATSSAVPQKVLFFVSDGVSDYNNTTSCTQPDLGGGRCQEPIDVSKCTAIKNRGIRIAVLYTTYLPLPTNDWYNTTVAPFAPQIPTRMQSCASPGLYFEVSPSGGIADAMNALFTKTVQSARLTQ